MIPSELARFTGVTLRTVRRWQKTGAIPEPERDDKGVAHWSPEQVSEILRWRLTMPSKERA